MTLATRIIKSNKIIRIATAVLAFMLYWVVVDSVYGAVPERIRIGVISSAGMSDYKNAGSIRFSVQGEYQILDLGAMPGLDLIGEVEEGSSWQVSYLTTGVQVLRDGQPLVITPGPVAVKEKSHSDSNLVKLLSYIKNGSTAETAINKRYRGDMEFLLGKGHLVGVNELPLEEYLYGVVPREVSASWPMEALKAQALAARNCAIFKYNKRLALGFNLLDTPDDQVYGGYNLEDPRTTLAVQETKGESITYEGKPIDAVYHSNSGGHTEDSENVWRNALPYLRGKPDPYSLKNGLGNWNYVTVSQGVDHLGRQGVQEKIKSIAPQFGTLAGFQLEKYPSGRVKRVVISDTSGYTIEKTGSEFGKLFNPSFYTYKNNASFMSNFFDVLSGNSFSVLDATNKVKNLKGGAGLMVVNSDGLPTALDTTQVYAAGAEGTAMLSIYPDNITFAGHGWGHGVGMSQWGAYQMALEGKDYREIIHFYYTGVEIIEE